MRRTWGTLALILAAALSTLPVFADDTGELTRYDIRVTLDPTAQALVGSQQVEYANDTGETLDELVFCLIGNWGAEPNPYLHPALLDSQYAEGFDPTWTQIHSVTDGTGEALSYDLEPTPPALQTYSLDDGLLVVELPAPLPPGGHFTLNVEFETKFAHGLLLDNCLYRDTYVWRFGWNPIAVSAAARDGGFVIPAADYHVELTVPEEYRAFGGADRQVELGTVAGLTSYELGNDRPARSVPLVIGTDLGIVSSEWSGVDLEAVYLPGGETFARLALSHTAEILASHSERYGPFGYRRLVIVENPSPGAYGMAADGMILVGRSLVRLKDMPALGVYDRLTEYLLAHEAAHLWWGIGIGADFDAENWISEGFAEYLSISYFEEKYGAFEANLMAHLGDGLIEDVIRDEFGHLNLRQHMSEAPYVDLLRLDFDEAIVKPRADVEYLNGQTVRTYNKGYLVLRALESVIGKETLRTALFKANEEWRGRTLTVEEFQRLVEGVSEPDLSAFFNDWLHGDARLDFGITGFETIETDTGFSTTIRLSLDGPELPVDVRVALADGATVEQRRSPGCCAPDALVVETAAPVVSIHLDPGEMLPDANRFDNHYPRRILIDHPFRAEDALQIGKPLDAYVITVSPTSVSGAFRNDHLWSLSAMPHVDVDAELTDPTDLFESWDIVGLFAADIDRRFSLSALAAVTALDISDGSGKIDAQATLHRRIFMNPNVGSAGTYWYPTYQLALTLGARGELARPIPYVEAALRCSDILSNYAENSLALQVGIPGLSVPSFASAEWSGAKRFRVAHLFYVDVSASAGSLMLGSLPTEFMFFMDRLHAFALPPYGYHQVYGRSAVVFPPLMRDQGYAVFNLTRLEDVTASAFLQGGRTWGGCELVCESGVRIEAGAMLTLRFDGFAGTSIEFSVGYAYPLFGLDGGDAPFVEFAAPF